MKPYLMAVVLLTGCSPQRVVEHLPTPPERLVCERAGDRPALPPEYAIDWSKVTTVPQAVAEHDTFVRSIRTREGKVAGYLVEVEDRLFTCWNNAEWRRNYEAGISPK